MKNILVGTMQSDQLKNWMKNLRRYKSCSKSSTIACVHFLTGNSPQVYKNFVLANEYQSSKLCEELYTKCEDKMDQLQVLKLPSMAKFNAGFLQCNQSFEMECVGPSKSSYEHRMTKVCIFVLFFLLASPSVLVKSRPPPQIFHSYYK